MYDAEPAEYPVFMSRSRLPLPLACALAIALSACSGDTRGPGGGGTKQKADAGMEMTDTGVQDEGIDEQAISAELAQAQCAYLTRCVPEYYDSANTDEPGCVQELTEAFAESFADIDTLMSADRMTYDEAQKDLCIQAYQTADCLLGIPDDSACNRVFVGTQQENAPCFFHGECGDGLYCNRAQGAGSCGTCATMPDRGETCDPFTPCQANTRCVDIGQQGPMYMCIPIDAQQGSACLTVQDGFCEGNLSCVGDQMTGFTCQPPSSAGAQCDNETLEHPECNLNEGYVCDGAMCGNAAWSDLSGTCGGTTLCREGYCDPASSTCSPLPSVGQSCADIGACGADAFCDGQNCRPLVADGQTCNASGECTGDLICLGAGVGRPGTCGSLTWQKCE